MRRSKALAFFRCVLVGALFVLVASARAADYFFTSPNPIVVPAAGTANPYPAIIPVNGVKGVVARLTVTLSNVTHTRPADLDILLIGPRNQNVLLLSDAGTNKPVANVTLTFDDAAPVPAREMDTLVSGTFRPTDYGPTIGGGDFFPNSNTQAPFGSALSVFNDTDPNGDWRLYVYDDSSPESGVIVGGWNLTITTHSLVFTNPTPIQVFNTGPASPFPSVINVAPNFIEPITKVTVTLFDVSDPLSANLDILLVGPTGDTVLLMSDAGGTVSHANLTFDDCAANSLPQAGAIVSGRYRPTNYGANDSFPNVQPPYGTDFSKFLGKPGVGNWQLLMLDDTGGADGFIAGGWELRLSTEPLAIVQQPAPQTTTLNTGIRFDVCVASATPVSYQWRLNGAALPGANGPTFALAAAQVSDAGTYTVTVLNSAGVLTSLEAPLRFSDIPQAPAADDFANRTDLSGNCSRIRGTNFFASKEPGEPNHGGKPGGKSVWYRWTPTAAGIATIQTHGSSFDTLLGVYTGTSIANLTRVASDEDRGGYFSSRVTFNASPSQSYNIAVDGYDGQEGTFILDWCLELGASQPSLTSEPSRLTVPEGGNASFSVAASGATLTYQWLYFGQTIPGATALTFTIPNVQLTNVGTYTVLVGDTAGRKVESRDAILEIGPNAAFQSRDKLADYSFAATGAPPGPGPAPFRAASTSPGSSPDVFNPFRMGLGSFSQGFSLGGASIDRREPGPCSIIVTNSRWISLQVTNSVKEQFLIDTAGSLGPHVLACYYCHSNDINTLTRIACDQTYDSRRPSFLCFPAVTHPTTTISNYFLVVEGLDNFSGSIQCNVRFGVRLDIERRAGGLNISWCGPNNAYALEYTTVLTNPPPRIDWLPVSVMPIYSNGTNTVRVDMPPPRPRTNVSYRLKRL